MKTNHLRFLSKLMFCLCISAVPISNLPAQLILKLQGTNTVVTDVPLQNIVKITFPAGTTLKIDKGVSSLEFPIVDIDKVFFGTSISSVNPVLTENKSIRLYPIPVKDNFTIEFNCTQTVLASIEITDLSGRVLMHQNTLTSTGINKFQINSSTLPKGLFLCSVRYSNKKEVVKFNVI